MVIYGKQAVLHLCFHHAGLVDEIILAKEVDKKLFNQLAALNKTMYRVDSRKASALAKGGNHQGFLAKARAPDLLDISQLKSLKKLIILDRVSDVGNIGAITRSAHCLGMDAVVVGGVKSFALDGVIRASSGAALEIPLALVENLFDLAHELKQDGFHLYGTAMEGDDVRTVEPECPMALFMGSEGEGLSNRLIKKMDRLLGIKLERDFDSLNVSVSAAMIMDRMR